MQCWNGSPGMNGGAGTLSIPHPLRSTTDAGSKGQNGKPKCNATMHSLLICYQLSHWIEHTLLRLGYICNISQCKASMSISIIMKTNKRVLVQCNITKPHCEHTLYLFTDYILHINHSWVSLFPDNWKRLIIKQACISLNEKHSKCMLIG